MAPTTSNAAKALQQNRQRPAAGPRQIIPAIPLSFVQKRQKSQSAKPKEEITVSSPPPPVVDEPSPSPTIQPEMAVVNGSTRDQSESLDEGTNESASMSALETPATEEGATESTVASVHESLGK